MQDGRISSVGTATAKQLADCDVVVDADGTTTAVPGLIDSHVHITFGDYTPDSKPSDFSRVTFMAASLRRSALGGARAPADRKDPDGVKALAIAAIKCCEHYRPGGMRVRRLGHHGAGTGGGDFAEMGDKGVWHAKVGFGSVKSPYDYVPMVGRPRRRHYRHGAYRRLVDPGPSGNWADHLLAIQPDVSYHVNGGPIAMPDEDFPRIVNESGMALQVCTAGNLRTCLWTAELLKAAGSIRTAAGRDRYADRKRHNAFGHARTRSRISPASPRFPSNGRSPPRPATMPMSIA